LPTSVPRELLEETYLPRIVVPLTPDRLEWWIKVMIEREMLKKTSRGRRVDESVRKQQS
jgi:hypothetical protein